MQYAACKSSSRKTSCPNYCFQWTKGLATAGYSIFYFTEDYELASNIGKVSESLVEKSSNKHALRSRLGNELIGTLKMLYEPLHSVATGWPGLYHSAMMAGEDPDYALICHWNSCSCKIFMGENLSSLSIQIEILMKETVMFCIVFNFWIMHAQLVLMYLFCLCNHDPDQIQKYASAPHIHVKFTNMH